ncbi:MAG: VCBS repeat-containing protein [Bacteroidia bacterium]|nr:VCBS repeat-containing protein [Bacteroidia bacterium]
MANTKGTSVINSPQGGGAQSGLGEKFSPDLFTGTGNFSVPIAVPPGRNGFQPELTLGYSSGNGNGIFGMGWALGIPGVTRKTAKGIPVYSDIEDIFILSGAEDLVPVAYEKETNAGVTWERTQYRPRTEGLFARIIRHKKSNGEHYWEVRSKDGLISWYGTPNLDPELVEGDGDPAIIANPENRNAIFAWHLTKTEDPFGNVILYNYFRDLKIDEKGRTYDQVYLDNIVYCQFPTVSDGIKYLCRVQFNYEERPDPFSAYKQGFEVRTTLRCTTIETYTNPFPDPEIKTKTYHFNYQSNLPLNGASLLDNVKVEGHNGSESEFMPPLQFGYSEFAPAKRELQEIKGPIPVNSLAEPGFELVDLNGNGLPDILQLNGVARYWTNKGNGKFSPPKELNIAPSVQLGMPGVQFIDANGDGRTDLLVNNGLVAGYFPGAFHKVWDTNGFRPYTKIPSFSFADPEVQLIDLDGDGITDVLRNGAKFECFYNDPVLGFNKVRTAIKTFADFSFADPRIRFADMTGDGLQDIVLISSGRVQYWPNMGYGRFGQKINMKNAPVFPEQYDPAQVLIGDLDGDGQADIAFVQNNTVTLYINQSGNAFSAPVKIGNTPRVTNPKALRIIDIMGTGQAGLLWSFGPDAGTPGKMYFLDFTKGNKPYVMQEMNNNMGSLTRVIYGSSVYHYLRDELQPASRWKTDLPFPVQVVKRVEVIDFLSGGKLVTEYNYHNGYWDGVEREFRGFAHVDSIDTETFTQYNLPVTLSGVEAPTYYTINNTEINYNQQTVTPTHYSPATKTKSWFYVGPVGDGFSRWHEPDFSDEYWSGDTNILKRPQSMLDTLAALPRPARRAALRTLRGTLLRSELYALDKSALQDRPYTVTESMMSLTEKFNPSQLPAPYNKTVTSSSSAVMLSGVEALNPDKQSYYVFFPFNIAQRTTQYERGTDAMHSFSFTKEYDAYGQPLGQLSVSLPRGLTPPGMTAYINPYVSTIGNYLATYSLSEYIYKDVAAGQYMVNRVKRSLGWDLTQSSANKTVFGLRDDIFSQYTNDPLTITFPVIGCTLNYYDGAAFTGDAYGVIGAYGAQVRSETLIITDAIIAAAYSSTPQCFEATPDWTTGYPGAFAGALQNSDDRLGYVEKTGDPYVDGWYAESARLKYDFHIDPLTAVGLTLESRDVFDAWSSIEYDDFLMMPLTSTQYLDLYPTSTNNLVTTAEYDYRVMQPFKVTDINENISVFDFSPLGLLRATALIGKGTEGDYITNSGGYYDRYAPSVKMDYDFFAFMNDGDPVWVETTSRELHYQQSAVSPTIIKVEYSDGFGRLLQTRVQAEDVIFGDQKFGSSGLPAIQGNNANAIGTQRDVSDPLNVVVSGWQIYNNKGKVVEKFEPFFDSGFDFMLPSLTGPGSGVRVRMFYDALERVVKTINPDSTEQWVIYGIPKIIDQLTDPFSFEQFVQTPWENYTYDANDLAEITHPGNTAVPASHNNTPKSGEIDCLGRSIRTREFFDNSNYTNNIEMKYFYDIRGNLLLVKDAYERSVFEHKYDIASSVLWTKHIDSGEGTLLYDATGKPIESHDNKDAMILRAYDVISRPNYNWARNNGTDAITLRNYIVFGETATTPSVFNLNGKVYQSYDEAGMEETPSFDFKGNLLSKNRQVIESSVLKAEMNTYDTFIVDWTGLPSILDTFIFTSDMEYDALNRITLLTLPEDVSTERKQIIPTYSNSGALQKVDLYSPAGPTTTNYVENISYNAKGQRLLISFGNGVMTRYTYDTLMSRLLRQRSEKFTKSVVGSTITYAYNSGTVRQDDGFNFDFVGNIIKLFDRMKDCGISNPDELDRVFEYDPVYRLTYADGRESNTQSGNMYLYEDAPPPSGFTDVRAYNRTYTYDKIGNVQSVIQGGTNGFTRTFNYNANVNTLDEVVDGSSSVIEYFDYDGCGNQVKAGDNRYYYWDHADRLICYKNQASMSAPTVFTQYDYSGQDRVSKMVRTGLDYERTIYIDGIFEYCILENGSTYEKNYIHVMDNKSRIAEVRVGDVFPGDITDDVVFIIEDQIGSSVMRIDTSGDEIDREEYYPFGDSSLRTFTYKRYRYVGKERDGESGLYYYGARYYAAWTCRFISVDPLADNYVHLTPYNYADNNPINDFDIDGQQDGNTQPQGGSETGNNGGGYTGGDETFNAEANRVLNEAKITGANVEISYGNKDGVTGGVIRVTGKDGNSDTRTYTPSGKWVKQGSDNLAATTLNVPKTSEHLPQSKNPLLRPKAAEARVEEDAITATQVLDGAQLAFDVLGLVPLVGEIFDGINAAIYAARGDYANAALSAAAMIPIAGWAATGAKLSSKFIIKGVYEITVDGVKYVGQSKDIVKRFTQHTGKNGRFAGKEIIIDKIHSMPGSTKKQREALEHQILDGWGGPGFKDGSNWNKIWPPF